MKKLLGALLSCLTTITAANATLLSLAAETSAIDTYVNSTHVVWGAKILSGLIDVQDSPYQTITNPNTGESVSRFSFAGSFIYAGQTANFKSGSFLAIFRNGDGLHQDSYAIAPAFQPFAVSSELELVAFSLQNTVTDTLLLDKLPTFDSLNTTWSYVNGNLRLASEEAVISYGGHDFAISSIPEPSTILLLLAASIGLVAASKSRDRPYI